MMASHPPTDDGPVTARKGIIQAGWGMLIATVSQTLATVPNCSRVMLLLWLVAPTV